MKATAIGSLARDTARPYYQQIKDTVRERIEAGLWRPGERMPSENQLVRELGVSRMTVHRALRELTQEGRLTRVHGVGTFVAEPREHASLVALQDIAEEIEACGDDHRAEVCEREAVHANEEVAELMELALGQSVQHLVLVHFRNDQPIQVEDRYVNPALAPGFLQVDFQHTTPTRYLTAQLEPDEVEHVVRATAPSAETRRRLRMGEGEPCLALRSRTWKSGRVVTAVSLYYPGGRYELSARYGALDGP